MNDVFHLDGCKMFSPAAAMATCGRACALPDWWGRNLDALSDCLGEPEFDCVRVVWTGHAPVRRHSAEYAMRIESVLRARDGLIRTIED